MPTISFHRGLETKKMSPGEARRVPRGTPQTKIRILTHSQQELGIKEEWPGETFSLSPGG